MQNISCFGLLLVFAACGGSQTPPESIPLAASLDAGKGPPDLADSATSHEVSPASASSTAPASALGSADAGAVDLLAPRASASSGSGPDRNLHDVQAILTNNRDAFRACYERTEKAHPGTKGRFALRFVLSPDGSIKQADTDSAKSDIHTEDMISCSVSALKQLKFPPSRRGMETTVNYPFQFNPGFRASDGGL